MLIVITSLFMAACHNEVINVPKRCYQCEFMIWENHIAKDGSQAVQLQQRTSRQYFRADGNVSLNEFIKRYSETYQSGDSIRGAKTVKCFKMDSVVYWDK